MEFYHRLMRLSDIFVESKAQQDEISGSGDEEQGKRLFLKDSMCIQKSLVVGAIA